MSSVPSEECVISSHSHRAPSEHTGQAVNSTVRLTRSETKMTNGPTRATVHPYRSGSCRNNLQQKMAPRRQGPWVPSLSRNGVFGAPPLGVIPTLVREYFFLWQLGLILFGMQARGPSRLLLRLDGSRVAAFCSVRREVVSGPAAQRVPTPRHLGVSQEWR